tara:strand:+ start:1987 stop:2553 length:567 start_codon:yes stop_codon:yes gene_type:complete
MKPKITTDGKTVWVNGPDSCLGRFGPAGAEVLEGLAPCLDYTGKPDWGSFVRAMLTHHNIRVSEDYKPHWLCTFSDIVGHRSVTVYRDSRVFLVITHGSIEERQPDGKWITYNDHSWESFVRHARENYDYEITAKRPLWTWDPDKWSRSFIKAHGRRKFREELDRLAKLNHLGPFLMAGMNMLHRGPE